MKFDELFNTLMEKNKSGSFTKGQQDDGMEARAAEYAKAQRKKKDKKEESDEEVAKKAKPYDKVTKADFLPKEVQDKINKEK